VLCIIWAIAAHQKCKKVKDNGIEMENYWYVVQVNVNEQGWRWHSWDTWVARHSVTCAAATSNIHSIFLQHYIMYYITLYYIILHCIILYYKRTHRKKKQVKQCTIVERWDGYVWRREENMYIMQALWLFYRFVIYCNFSHKTRKIRNLVRI